MKLICGKMVGNITEYTAELYTPLVAILFITALPVLLPQSSYVLNLAVIYTIVTNSSLQTPSRMLLCSLAFSDFFIGLFGQPAASCFFISAFEKWQKGFFASAGFVMTKVHYTMICVAFMNLAAMSIDWCLALRTMTNYKNFVTKKRTVCLIVIIWILGFAGTNLSLQFLTASPNFWKQ